MWGWSVTWITAPPIRIRDQGDRVGGIVFGDAHVAEIRPARTRASLDRFLAALAEANGMLAADAPNATPMPLNRVLRAVARIAPRNHLVLVLSDFDAVDEETRRLVSTLSRRNDLVLGLVSDPFAEDPLADASAVQASLPPAPAVTPAKTPRPSAPTC